MREGIPREGFQALTVEPMLKINPLAPFLKGKRMLILTAKAGELIYVGRDVKIIVLNNSYSDNELSLGFDAPEHIPILRQKAKVKFKKVKENA
jgi:carbon storage regulator CsrA